MSENGATQRIPMDLAQKLERSFGQQSSSRLRLNKSKCNDKQKQETEDLEKQLTSIQNSNREIDEFEKGLEIFQKKGFSRESLAKSKKLSETKGYLEIRKAEKEKHSVKTKANSPR